MLLSVEAVLLSVISIHALRVEGDFRAENKAFLDFRISIHALRVEGDNPF